MDKQEFTQRVLALEPRLYRISHGILQNTQDQLDAVQESLFKAWTGLSRLRNEAYFETWLTRILIHECQDLLKRRKKNICLDLIPEPSAPPEGANQFLYHALMQLPLKLRLPLTLSYMEGYRQREIAHLLHIPEGTVKSRILKAKSELKKLLEPEKEG